MKVMRFLDWLVLVTIVGGGILWVAASVADKAAGR